MKKTKIYLSVCLITFVLLISTILVYSNPTGPSTPLAQQYTEYPDQIGYEYTREQLLSYEWTQDRSNPSLDAYVEGPSPSSFDISWKYSGASFAGGFYDMVFVSAGGKTLGLDPWTGEELWSIDYTGALVKLDEEYMLIGQRCIRFATKEVVWEIPWLQYLMSSWQVGVGTCYIPELKQFFVTGNLMYKLDPNDLSIAPTLAWNRSDVMEGSQHYYVWNTYGDGRMYVRQITSLEIQCFDAITGELLWHQNTKGRLIFGGIYHEGVYMSGSLEGVEYGYDAATGELLWEYDPGTFWNMWASRPGAAAYGIYYGINCDRHMYAIDVHTGKCIWKYEGPGHFYNNHAIVTGGKVYWVSGTSYYRDPDTYEFGHDEFACLDAFTGEVIFKAPIMTSSAAFACFGQLFVMPQWRDEMSGNIGGTGGSIRELWCISGKPKDWAMFGADPSHTWTGTGPDILKLKWTFEAEGSIVSAPTIADGVVYVGSYDYNVYALDAFTGEKIWEFPTGYQVKSSPAVVDGRVYIGPDDGTIYCLDADSGTVLWDYEVGGPIRRYMTVEIGPQTRSSPTVIDGKLFVGHLNGFIYCINAITGHLVWERQTGGEIMSAPAVVDDEVYINSNTPGVEGTLFKLDADDGSIIWTLGIPYDRDEAKGGATSKTAHWLASPTVGDGMVFIPADGRNQYCINATTSEIIWMVRYSEIEESLVPHMMSMIYDPGMPTYVKVGEIQRYNDTIDQYELRTTGNGKVYTMDSFFRYVCINATNGETLYKTWLGREIYGLAKSLHRLYVSYEQEATFVFNTEKYHEGEKVSYYEFNTLSWSKPSLWNNKMYLGGHDWKVYCFEETPMDTTYYG
jgi:outer membrane protein assembly factor BamB